jgi:hypothetical protein
LCAADQPLSRDLKGSGLVSLLFCDEPISQKHRKYANRHTKNEQCGSETVTTVGAAAHLRRITGLALSEVDGGSLWFLGCLLTLLFQTCGVYDES